MLSWEPEQQGGQQSGVVAGASLSYPVAMARATVHAVSDEHLSIQTAAAGITELFNAVVGFVLARQDDPTVVISDQAGRVARIDRRTATNPLELLGLVTMFNPPAGMG